MRVGRANGRIDPGKIEAVHDGDTYDVLVLFDDGDREENKIYSQIRVGGT